MNLKTVFDGKAMSPVRKIDDEMVEPLSGYSQGKVVPNTVYSVVTMDNSAGISRHDLFFRIVDVGEKTSKWRGLFLTARIEDTHASKQDIFGSDPARWPFVRLGFNIVPASSFIRPSEDPLFEKLFYKVWPRGVFALCKLLASLQSAYVKDTPSCKHTPWLKDLTYAETKAFAHRLDFKIGSKW